MGGADVESDAEVEGGADVMSATDEDNGAVVEIGA